MKLDGLCLIAVMVGAGVTSSLEGWGHGGSASRSVKAAAAPRVAGGVIFGEYESHRGCLEDGAPFRDAVQAIHDEQENVGYAAAVMLDGTLVESVVGGLADLEHGMAIKPSSRFGIASVTKAFTASALLTLYETGVVDLDAPVQQFVPEYVEHDEGVITIRQLLTHTSGIPHLQSRPPSLYATHYDDVLDALEVFRDDPLLFAPGTAFRYSSSNYNLLAAVIQRLSGQRFQDYVQQAVFEPLGLDETGFDDVRWVLPNRTRRYAYFDPWSYTSSERLHRIPGRWDYSFNTGGGNVISTAEDLVKFGNAFAEPGFFLPETLEMTYSPIPTGEVETPWSFGWFATTDYAGRRRLHMNGANPGLQAELTVYPDHDLVIAVVANSWGHGARSAEMVSTARFAARCMGWPDPTQ